MVALDFESVSFTNSSVLLNNQISYTLVHFSREKLDAPIKEKTVLYMGNLGEWHRTPMLCDNQTSNNYLWWILP